MVLLDGQEARQQRLNKAGDFENFGYVLSDKSVRTG